MPRSGTIASTLDDIKKDLAKALHLPANAGVELRPVRVEALSGRQALAVYIHGLADEELVRTWVLEPLTRSQPGEEVGTAGWAADDSIEQRVMRLLPAPRLRLEKDQNAAIHDVLAGAVALFIAGCSQAVVAETATPVLRGGGVSEELLPERFGVCLEGNIAQLRMRLRDPKLVAEPQTRNQIKSEVVLVYIKGRAANGLADQVRKWAQEKVSEKAAHLGRPGGKAGQFGLLPQVVTTPFPDIAATLLDSGYVAVLLDRAPLAYVAPVTAAALAYGVGDEHARRPFVLFLRSVRWLLAGLVIFLPGLAVALLEYHQEMVPTPMVLALAAVRENMSLPFVGEMLAVELLQEVTREGALRLAPQVTLGQSLIASTGFVILLTFTGYLGPTAAAVSLVVSFATLALPSYDLAFLARSWRWYMLICAFSFGLFGIGAAAFVLAAYLCHVHSFGVPFLGETGLRFSMSDRSSSRVVGGKLRAATRAHR